MERLTKQDIADGSGLTIGKVKNYIKLFPEYFEEIELSGRKHPVYSVECVEIVKLIAGMIRKHDHEDIKTALNKAGYSPYIEMIPKSIAIDDGDTAITIQQDSLFEVIEAQKQVIEVQRDVIKQQKQIIDDLRQELDD